MEAMSRLIGEMKTGLCDSPVIAEQMDRLSQMLGNAEGRKVYGYLKKPVPGRGGAVLQGYTPGAPASLPAEGVPCHQEHGHPGGRGSAAGSVHLRGRRQDRGDRRGTGSGTPGGGLPAELWEIYRNAREVLSRWDSTETEKAKQVQTLEQLWEDGFPAAAHQLGKCWRDGLRVFPDDEQAELWFRRGAEAGYDFSQYALGRLLETQKRMEEAVAWYEKAAAQGNPAAAYRLGKLYLQRELVPKDVPKALEYLTASARTGQPVRPVHFGQAVSHGKRCGARPGKRRTAGLRCRRNREICMPGSSWNTLVNPKAPPSADRHQAAPSAGGRSFRRTRFLLFRRAASGPTGSYARRSARRRSPWARSRGDQGEQSPGPTL